MSSLAIFLSTVVSSTYSRYHTDILMRLRSTNCHTCIQGQRPLHADNVSSFPPLLVCLPLVSLSLSLSQVILDFFSVCICVCCMQLLCVISVNFNTEIGSLCYQSPRDTSRHLLSVLSCAQPVSHCCPDNIRLSLSCLETLGQNKSFV